MLMERSSALSQPVRQKPPGKKREDDKEVEEEGTAIKGIFKLYLLCTSLVFACQESIIRFFFLTELC